MNAFLFPKVIVLIPRGAGCSSMSVLCLQVSPSPGSGWNDTGDGQTTECIDVADRLDCDGANFVYNEWLGFGNEYTLNVDEYHVYCLT